MKQKIIKCNNIKEDRGILSNQIKTKRKKRIKMALVEEKVKEEDRELFNSFVPSRKANECTKWIVDREKNIYIYGEQNHCRRKSISMDRQYFNLQKA